jgi:hypothetical protein
MTDPEQLLPTLLSANLPLTVLPSLKETDWAALAARSDLGRVSSLLCDRLLAANLLPEVPESVRDHLLRYFQATTAQNLRTLAALEDIVAALEGRAITLLLLKGAGLLMEVYDHPGLRPMNDLDVLVLPEQLRAALDCLQDLGYEPLHAEQFPDAYVALTHHVEMAREIPFRQVVELHHYWLDVPASLGSALSMQAVFARAEPIPVGKSLALRLEVHDQLLHLAAHLASQDSITERLIWCCDLDRLICRQAGLLDWDLVLRRAVAYHMVLPLQRILPVLATRFATPVPVDVLAQLPALPLHPAERRHYGRESGGQFSRLADGWRKLAGLPGMGARLRFARQLMFPSRAYMRSVYGADSSPFGARHYVSRWASVAGEFLAAVINRPT